MGLLDGGAAAAFGELLSPLYLPARLRSAATTYTEGGAIRRARAPRACRVQVDRATERMVGTEGYTDTDRSIYILASSVEGGAGDIDTDADVEVLEGPYAGEIFKLAAPIDRDPAAAYVLARGVRKKQGVTTGG